MAVRVASSKFSILYLISRGKNAKRFSTFVLEATTFLKQNLEISYRYDQKEIIFVLLGTQSTVFVFY